MRVGILLCLGCLSLTAGAEESRTFDEYLAQVRQHATERGIRKATLEQAFVDLTPDPRVIRFDRRQPEFVQTFEEYLTARVSAARISQARTHYREHEQTLDRIAESFGVDPEYLVAFWGLESSFGRYQGKYDIVRSLATLGHDARRSAFFTRELHAALKILDEGHVTRSDFVGGWAGAMGQNQFLPSTFLNYAVDFDRDGRKDIWANRLDIWASIANYLSSHNWRRGAGWGFAVKIPSTFDIDELPPAKTDGGCRALRQHTEKRSLAEWRTNGIERSTATDGDLRYALILPAKGDTGSYLVGGNFRSILAYNCANKYAVSVGLLADAIR